MEAGAALPRADPEAQKPKRSCPAWWNAEHNLRARGPKWLPEIIRLTWYLQLINLVFAIHGTV